MNFSKFDRELYANDKINMNKIADKKLLRDLLAIPKIKDRI
jgi:hypothetical protein